MQEDGVISAPTTGKLNFNSLTDRTLSPPGTGGLLSGNRSTPSGQVTNPDAIPVNKALTDIACTLKRPASPMGSAILKGQFLD